MQPEQIRATLLALEAAPKSARMLLIEAQVKTTGGYVHVPREDDTWGPCFFEMSLHSISAMASTEDELIRNWCLAANRQLELLDHEANALIERVRAACEMIIAPRPVPSDALIEACDLVINHPHFATRSALQLAPQILAAQRMAA